MNQIEQNAEQGVLFFRRTLLSDRVARAESEERIRKESSAGVAAPTVRQTERIGPTFSLIVGTLGRVRELEKLLDSPEEYLKTLQPDLKDHPYILWKWPEDRNRNVMIPPGKFLLLVAPVRFRATLCVENEPQQEYNSLVDAKGRHFAIYYPQSQELPHKRALLHFSAFSEGKVIRDEGHLLLLAPDILKTTVTYSHDYIRKHAPLTCMQANGRGALMHLRLKHDSDED